MSKPQPKEPMSLPGPVTECCRKLECECHWFYRRPEIVLGLMLGAGVFYMVFVYWKVYG